MAQYSLPVSDAAKTNWSEGAGDGDASAFDELDEGFGAGRGSGSGPDDATTYWLATDDTYGIRMSMAVVTDPGVTTGHIGRIRTRKSAADGQQQDHQISLSKPPGTTSLGYTIYVNVDAVWTTREHTWNGVIGAPFDYDDLAIACLFSEVGGGPGREAQDSAHEFECPDAGPAVTQPYYMRTGGVPGMRIGRPGSIFGRTW